MASRIPLLLSLLILLPSASAGMTQTSYGPADTATPLPEIDISTSASSSVTASAMDDTFMSTPIEVCVLNGSTVIACSGIACGSASLSSATFDRVQVYVHASYTDPNTLESCFATTGTVHAAWS